MQPKNSFRNESPWFWAFIKYASGRLGYSSTVVVPSLRRYSLEELVPLAESVNLDASIAERACRYLNYRAALLEDEVEPLLMNREGAQQLFEDLMQKHTPQCTLPFNKQKREKRHHAYFTCIVNILTEVALKGKLFDDNPGKFTTITDAEGRLIKTLSRRIDGAFPSLSNPFVVWEIKEYYGTTTFGSRVADGVYETQLDGYELRDAEKLVGHKVKHYLFVDDHFTWWVKGRSYLCRLIDIMHEGLVDEVLFGREVIERWPQIVRAWHKE